MSDGYYPLPADARRTVCRSCGAPIAFVTTISGAQMPLNLGTVEQRDGVTMAQTHYATCPQAAAWREKAAQQPLFPPDGVQEAFEL